MNIRWFNKETDYSKVLGWSKERGLDYPPLDFLSDTGFIVEDACSAFLYRTNSNVLFLEALISNPNISKESRSKSLDILFGEIVNYSKVNNFKYIYCNLESKILEEKLKKFNFFVTEKSVFIGLGIL